MKGTPGGIHRLAVIELGLVILTGVVHFVFENLFELKLPFMLAAGAFWTVWLAWRLKTVPGLAVAWGIRRDNLASAAIPCAIAGGLGLVGMTAWGFHAGHFPAAATFWIVLLLYPVWGFVQQFLLNALLASNLRRLLPSWAVVPIAAVLFSAAHAPDLPLMALTLVAGVMWSWIYLARPNLWVLGLSHGILGAVAYYGVLGRDAWATVWPA